MTFVSNKVKIWIVVTSPSLKLNIGMNVKVAFLYVIPLQECQHLNIIRK